MGTTNQSEKIKYYRTKKDTLSSVMFLDGVSKKIDSFHSQIKELRSKYNFDKVSCAGDYYLKIHAVTFKEEPDLTIWEKMPDTINGYMPRLENEEGSKIKDDLDKIIDIKYHEFEGVIFRDSQVYGFSFDNRLSDYYIMKIPESNRYLLATDFEEITEEEYMKLLEKEGIEE